MQANTDSQARRRKDAIKGAVFTTIRKTFCGVLLLWLCSRAGLGTFFTNLLMMLALLEFGMLVPVWISLKLRLKEIQGGEEDAASQY